MQVSCRVLYYLGIFYPAWNGAENKSQERWKKNPRKQGRPFLHPAVQNPSMATLQAEPPRPAAGAGHRGAHGGKAGGRPKKRPVAFGWGRCDRLVSSASRYFVAWTGGLVVREWFLSASLSFLSTPTNGMNVVHFIWEMF